MMLNECCVDIWIMLKFDVLVVDVGGLIDFVNSWFVNFVVDVKLLMLGVILLNLCGCDVIVWVVLDGVFVMLMVDYKVKVVVIGFGEIMVENVYVEGLVWVNVDCILVLVNVCVWWIMGFNLVVGGFVNNVRI